jgi:O-antigen/teichoic acid export membrane protein
VVAARALGKQEYAPLSVLWAVGFLTGQGFVLPLEQEVGRVLAARRTRGEGGGPVIRRAAVVGAVLLAAVLAGIAAFHGPLTEHLLSGDGVLVVAWGLALAGTAAGHLSRGVFAGQGRFLPYAWFIGGESGFRAVACIALAVLGVSSVGPYGIAFGLAPFLGLAVAFRGQRGFVEPGPPATMAETSSALAALLVGSLLSMVLVNAGPIAIELLAKPSQDTAVSRFVACLVIARVPLFLFQAVQAALLPRLSELASSGELDELKAGMDRLLALLFALVGVGVVAALAVGPQVVTILFGGGFELGRRTMGLLALGSGAYLVAAAVSQANIALGGHVRMAMAWAAGVVGFLAAVAFASDDLFLRVEAAIATGGFAALGAQAAVLLLLLRSGAEVSSGDLVEALTDLPLEP